MNQNKKIVAKKSLGQHFLIDENISEKIIIEVKNSLNDIEKIIEIGPGTGALTKYFFKEKENLELINKLFLVELDKDMVKILKNKFPVANIINKDFLKLDIEKEIGPKKILIIGNLPYNISTQILYKILENKSYVNKAICMLQKEVAERITSPPKSKKYGIPSVLLQAFYDCKLLFDVPPSSFDPIPKVNSAVIKLSRNNRQQLNCDENKFFRIVKMAFNQRRKTLRNALKSILLEEHNIDNSILNKRAEELSVVEFEQLTSLIYSFPYDENVHIT